MRWKNTETPTFAGSAGSTKAPAVTETMELVDRDGNVVKTFTKDVAGAFSEEGGLTKATGAEVNTGTNDTHYVTPKDIADSKLDQLQPGVLTLTDETDQYKTEITVAGLNATETDGGDIEFNFNAAGGGTIDAPTVVDSGQAFGAIRFRGHNGAEWQDAAMIRPRNDGDISFRNVPGRVDFFTNTASGVLVGLKTRLAITSQGFDDLNAQADLAVGVAATAEIGSGANGTVTVAVRTTGSGGNTRTVEIFDFATPDQDLEVNFNSTSLSITLGTDGAGALDPAKNTAALIAAAINSTAAGWQGTASGTGASPITAPEGPTTLSGGTNGTSVGIAGQVEVRGAVIQGAPTASLAAALLNGQISFFLDEVGNKLKVAVKYSDGTAKTGEIALT